jgi:DNA ligase-1
MLTQSLNRRDGLGRLLVLSLGLPLAPSAISALPAAPPLLLAQKAPAGLDPSRYWVSEKLDGVRAYWDGQRLFTRHGQPIAAPGWFIAHLPAQALDGELWMARGKFEAASAAVRRQQPLDEEWRALHYMVFELPGAPGSFEQRAGLLRTLAAQASWEGLQAVPQERLPDNAALQARLAAVVRAGGEGLMLHESSADYQSGRQPSLLKLKPHDDDEAVVLGHVAGAGRLQGMLGALRVRNAAGQEFSIGSGFTDAQRRTPPAIGSTVTYRYRGLTGSGLPRFATFLREQPL